VTVFSVTGFSEKGNQSGNPSNLPAGRMNADGMPASPIRGQQRGHSGHGMPRIFQTFTDIRSTGTRKETDSFLCDSDANPSPVVLQLRL
jgi:hypothetical protein